MRHFIGLRLGGSTVIEAFLRPCFNANSNAPNHALQHFLSGPMNESHESALQVLAGLPLRRIGRAADLLWLQFGDLRQVVSRRGDTREVGEWALHIQTAWRFTRSARIVVGVRELYYTAGTGEDYDWDEGGESRFDRLAADLNREFEASSTIVTSITCDRVGGFSLWFGPDFSFDVFPNAASTSPGFEFWRLFQPATKNPHFVVATESTGNA